MSAVCLPLGWPFHSNLPYRVLNVSQFFCIRLDSSAKLTNLSDTLFMGASVSTLTKTCPVKDWVINVEINNTKTAVAFPDIFPVSCVFVYIVVTCEIRRFSGIKPNIG